MASGSASSLPPDAPDWVVRLDAAQAFRAGYEQGVADERRRIVGDVVRWAKDDDPATEIASNPRIVTRAGPIDLPRGFFDDSSWPDGPWRENDIPPPEPYRSIAEGIARDGS